MEAENATEISLKISIKEICYQYYYEDEYWYKEKKNNNCPPQTRMIQYERSVVPRLRNPGIKNIPCRRKNTHKSKAWDLWEIPNDVVFLCYRLCEEYGGSKDWKDRLK